MSIKGFLETIATNGGMSLTNSYEVLFDFSNVKTPADGGSPLTGRLNSVGVPTTRGNGKDLISLMCNKAQLPNIATRTGQITGRYLGEGQIDYAAGRLYSAFSLTFMNDANMTPLKFLTAWHDYIFRETNPSAGGGAINPSTYSNNVKESLYGSAVPRPINRPMRLRYPDEYMCTIKIAKTEMGRESATDRASVVYVIENAWPEQIDAVPIEYGNSQITEVTANFRYTRHHIVYNDIKNYQKRNK